MALVAGQPLRWALVSMLVAGSWAIPHVARACSCAQRLSPTQALTRADVVFEGRVTRVPTRTDFAKGFGGTVSYEFEVERYWKGVVESTMSLHTPSSGAACGRRFRAGERYLVYARVDGQTGNLVDTICSRTRESRRADEDFSRLPNERRVSSSAPSRNNNNNNNTAGREPPFLEPPPPSLDFPAEGEVPPGCQITSTGQRAPIYGLTLIALGLLGRRQRQRRRA